MLNALFGTMSTRIFLIVVSGILITASLVNLLGQRDMRANESHIRAQFAYERIENIIGILDATIPDKRHEIEDLFASLGSRVSINALPPAHLPPLPTELASLQAQLVPEVADVVGLAGDCHPRHGMRHGRPPFAGGEPHGFRPPPDFPPREAEQCLAIYTHLEDQTPVLIRLHYGRRPPPMRSLLHNQPFSIALLIAGLLLLAWIVSSVATKPLRKLGQAALQLAKNIERQPLPEHEGPIEVRNAASAFNEMQRSILKHVQERTFILGAIAHDLQTPLTRLRLRLEKVRDTELKQKLIEDLSATQEMVREGLDFARLCSEHIDKHKVDLVALAQAVCDDLEDETGIAIARQLPESSLFVMGSNHLLRRGLTNLLKNAISYAETPMIQLSEAKSGVISCVISDSGPGIPGHELSAVLEPFRRVEDSRSRHTGGTGLGLSIVRMIVEKHDGQLQLRNKPAPEHGLIVEITLPQAQPASMGAS